MDSLDDGAKERWKAVEATVKGAKMSDYFNPPKPHKRRPDNEWDNVVQGADLGSIWKDLTKNVKDTIEEYSMRTKVVDPSKLGVDPNVKQYSGYLDDNSTDKHLFFCTIISPWPCVRTFSALI